MTKKNRSRAIVAAIFCALFLVWVFVLFSYRNTAHEFFPDSIFEIYEVTDASMGGNSTAVLDFSDSTLGVEINVRSGVAYPAVGVGFNLRSVNNRPVDYFDFSKYDSLEIVLATKRMNSVSVRVMTDDPVYTRAGFRETLRPVVYNVSATRSFESVKFPVTGFRTAVWWIAAMGMEKDDGLTHLHRSVLLEITNGDGVMRGIPDEINVKKVRVWGINRDLEKAMYAILLLMAVTFVLIETGVLKRRMDGNSRK
ncbi:hypothetical protein [Fibrobacter sp. UWR2]|uniref:hypothetical protein n=1 Tax=Fibrobacter sp. UWR2 TaxID=1964352 RepID=UPI000B51F68B|nr:hypothetical protein [Fibrobacter sp. UWR2]OWV01892.1 hypothetical protein B7994_01315 [Fibrobacter sp. UWR2]